MDKNVHFAIINYFRNHYDLGMQIGTFDSYNDETFTKILDQVIKMFSINITLEDRRDLKRQIDAEFQIYQPDGEALEDDYNHDSEWYTSNKKNITEVFWPRYRTHLFNNGWPTNIITKLDYDTLDRLMNFLGDPNSDEKYARKGLVMGDVQSGKTSNYIGLICKAVDAGYKVIILLTGVLESLRRQTQIRVEEGFIGYDVDSRDRVGVGINSPENVVIPKSVTSRINDFTGSAGENTLLHFNNNEKTPFIFITKKNSKTLKKIRDTITNINIIPPKKKIETSLLIIDDEADNASINTNRIDDDPTKINSEIRSLLKLFAKSNYVGFTATPFANVFIDPDSETEMLDNDLFPKNFIYSLKPPNNYLGAEKIFLEKEHGIVQIIDDYNDVFPVKHKKDWDGNTLFPSLIEAINTFLLINAIRDLRENESNNSHRSMLINVSRFIKVQEKLELLINNKFDNIMNSISSCYNLPYNEYIKNSYIKDLNDTYKKHYSNNYTWSKLFSIIYNSTKDIKIYKVPSKNKKQQLDYDKHKEKGLRVIVIGGLALSRGLTLEGLTISYLYRNTSTFDVLMQMGRWFGYRSKPKEYGDLCRVWMLSSTNEYFEEITSSIKELKDDFKQLSYSNKTPREFGIRVRNESDKLGITGRGKMRTSKKYVYTYDLFGEVLETPFINANKIDALKNFKVIDEFIYNTAFKKIDGKLFSSSVDAKIITKLLSNLKIHEANRINYFEKDKIIKFIEDYELLNFDVLIMSGNATEVEYSNVSLNPVERSFDLLDYDTIRVSAAHRRLGGTGETKYGLSKRQIDDLTENNKISNSLFMIEGRNPIFIIYPLRFKKVSKLEEYSKDETEKINNLVDNYIKENIILHGIGIGFPKDRDRSSKQTKVFYINDRTKWWNLMLRKDNEEDE